MNRTGCLSVRNFSDQGTTPIRASVMTTLQGKPKEYSKAGGGENDSEREDEA
jgi:hypothetical protein